MLSNPRVLFKWIKSIQLRLTSFQPNNNAGTLDRLGIRDCCTNSICCTQYDANEPFSPRMNIVRGNIARNAHSSTSSSTCNPPPPRKRNWDEHRLISLKIASKMSHVNNDYWPLASSSDDNESNRSIDNPRANRQCRPPVSSTAIYIWLNVRHGLWRAASSWGRWKRNVDHPRRRWNRREKV